MSLHYLEVVDSPRLPVGIQFKLSPGAPSYKFGREKSSDMHHIRIPEANVSRSHAIIFCRSEEKGSTPYPFICDMGSVIGTFVNDIRISQERTKSLPHQLTHNDEILIGQTRFKIVHHKDYECNGEDDHRTEVETDLFDDIDTFSDDAKSSCSSYTSKVRKLAALSRMKDSVEKDAVVNSPSFSNPIPETNVGFKMLKKLGWTHGKGLGRDQQGTTAPIGPELDGSDFYSKPSFPR